MMVVHHVSFDTVVFANRYGVHPSRGPILLLGGDSFSCWHLLLIAIWAFTPHGNVGACFSWHCGHLLLMAVWTFASYGNVDICFSWQCGHLLLMAM